MADLDLDLDVDADADAENDDIPSRLLPLIPLLIDIGDIFDCASVLILNCGCDEDADDNDDDDDNNAGAGDNNDDNEDGFICDDRLVSVEKLDVNSDADADADADTMDAGTSLVFCCLISLFRQRPKRWLNAVPDLVPSLYILVTPT